VEQAAIHSCFHDGEQRDLDDRENFSNHRRFRRECWERLTNRRLGESFERSFPAILDFARSSEIPCAIAKDETESKDLVGALERDSAFVASKTGTRMATEF
jgi:hypothetical protein